jgi:hypothetical protein
LAALLSASQKIIVMKKIGIMVLCLLAVVLVRCDSGRSESTFVSDDNTTITTSETETRYSLEASFNEQKAMEIFQYINSAIGPNAQFAFEDGGVDAHTSLDDGTTFHIKAGPTELTIDFDKEANTHESYRRMKKLYHGIRKLVK